MRKIHLKIKIKSLAEEARIIRHEARKIDKKILDREQAGRIKQDLNDHRTGIVREEARHSLLAYGLIRDVPYPVMEKKCNEAPNWSKIEKMAFRFGATKVEIAVWMALAKEHIKNK
jgi:hypothetical protein